MSEQNVVGTIKRGRFGTPCIVIKCATCTKTFTLQRSEYRRRVKRGMPPKYCSNKCAATGRRRSHE